MKWFLILWAAPIILLGSWYGLSYNDINFGIYMLTRDVHDLVFQIYGNILGIPPEDIPPLVLRAIIVDTFIVVAIIAFRKRRQIRQWWAERRKSEASQDEVVSESLESLSSAP